MSLLSDEIFEQISSSTAENLRKSRNILDKISRRKLPKFVGEARLTEENMSKVGQKRKNTSIYCLIKTDKPCQIRKF